MSMVLQTNKKVKMKLKYSMSVMIVFCWLVPLLLFTYLLQVMVVSKMNSQIENTIVTSADKAIEICIMQMEDVITASRNASYITTVKDSYNSYLKTGNEQDLYNNVTLFLSQQYRYNKNLEKVYLYFVDKPEEIYYVHSSGNSSDNSYVGIREFEAKYQEQITKGAEAINTGVELMYLDDRLFMIRNMVDSSFEPFAIIVMELKKSSIFESLESIWGATGYDIYINAEPLIIHGKEEFGVRNNLGVIKANSTYVHSNNASYTYKVVKGGAKRIGFVIDLDAQVIVDELAIVRSMLMLLIAFMIPLILIIFLFFYRKVTRPIGRLVLGAKEIQVGNYGYQLQDSGNSWEFNYLCNSFNAMSNELKHQFVQIYQEELELKEAEIRALQSQINPHFLNNTLEIINWECRMTGSTKASSMIEALSVMLNATMNRKKQNLITLTEELSYVDAYLLIIQQRFGSRFHVRKQIDHSILWVEVPRLIIQPIIENAVSHGMDAKNQGQVTLDIFAVENMLHIEVTNNGVMTEADRKRIEQLLDPDYQPEEGKSVSLGIRNVNRRIKIIYGNECGLTITSNEEGHTVSRILIDMNYNRENEDISTTS